MSKILYDTTDAESISDLINDQFDLIEELRFIIDQQYAVLTSILSACVDLQSIEISRVKAANMKNAVNITTSELRREVTNVRNV